MSNPALGYAAYCAVKLVGYTVYAATLNTLYRQASRHTVPLDGSKRIAGDIRCPRCGYNLRSLLADGPCTECGALIKGSFPHGLIVEDWHATLAPVVGLLRTLLGMAVGFGYQIAFEGTHAFELPASMDRPVFLTGLIPIRMLEWSLIIWLFYDRRWSRRTMDVIAILAGVLVSFVLDVPGILGFCIVGGFWVC